jgi:hypothetical protein
MPRLIENPDGTKTFTINSSELRVLRNRLVESLPDVKKMMQILDTQDVRDVLRFLKSAVD